MGFSAFDLVVGSRQERMSGRVRKGELLPLGRGRYLPVSFIPSKAPGWEVRRIVSKARAIAAVADFGESNPGILTSDAALLSRGVPTLHSVPSIEFWRMSHKANRGVRHFPAVDLKGASQVHHVPAAVCKEFLGVPHVWGALDVEDRLFNSLGVRVAGLEQAMLDLVRYSHPLLAFTNASAAFAAFTRFDKFDQVVSRRRAEHIRQRLLDSLEALTARRGNPRARALLRSIDPGTESPAEAVVLWAIKVLLRGNTARQALYSTQHHVFAGDNEYFLDVGFPYARFGIEFDGVAKMQEGESAQRRFLRRQADLTRDGWHVRRFTTSDYLDLTRLFRTLSQDLESRGVSVMAPGGALWRPVPRSMLDPARLF